MMNVNGHRVQVFVNGHDQAQTYDRNGSSQHQTRPLNVDEALQYSSMSSAPIFGLGWSLSFIELYLN